MTTSELNKYYSTSTETQYYVTLHTLEQNRQYLRYGIGRRGFNASYEAILSSDAHNDALKRDCTIVSHLMELERTDETTINRSMIWPDLAPVRVSIDDLSVLSGMCINPQLVYKQDPNTLIGLDGSVYHKCDICGEWTPTAELQIFENTHYCSKLGCEDAAMPSYYSVKTLASVPEQFTQRQYRLRNEAISYQFHASTASMSYADLADASEYFSRLGEKYDLTDEFIENGIL